MGRVRRVWFVVLAALLGACGDSPSERGDGPSVVLITLDTFRDDYMGCSGNPVVRTPHLDRLARRGAHWPDAVTPIPLTTPSHASILSGLSPRRHGLLKNRMRLPEWVETLPEMLRDTGVRTGAVVSSPIVLDPELGLDRGFDTYRVIDIPERPASGEGAIAASLARDWIRTEGGPESFLWAHFFDTHLPYLPPAPLDRLYDPDYEGPFQRIADRKAIQTLFGDSDEVNPRDVEHVVALYASEVTFLDRCVGSVIREAVAKSGRGTYVLLTADHGEGLYDHERYFGHDMQLYDTSLKVPMLLAGEGITPGIVSEPARTLDVAPTLLALFGMERGLDMEGRDLLGDPAPTGDALQFIAESHPAKAKAPPLYALRTDTHKVIWQPRNRRHEFYDLESDPRETRDLSSETSRLFEALAGDLELDIRNRPVGKTQTIDEERGGADEDVTEQMRALGYVD